MATVASSYPVLWLEPDGQSVTGELTAGIDTVQLDGRCDGRLVQRTVAYRDLAGVRIGRSGADLLGGRPALVVEPHGSPALLVRPLGMGLLTELADLITQLCAKSEPVEQIAVVVPVKPDAVDAARALVAQGPPFDLADNGLERHEIFFVGNEAIFVFSGADACESVRRILRDATVWSVAEQWEGFLAGPPRLAEASFAWAQEAS